MHSTDSSTASTISSVNDDFNSSRSTHDDPILPTTEQVEHVLARSRHVWQGHLEKAKSIKCIPQESLRLSNWLHRLPALPDDLKGVSSLQGQSTWRRTSPVTCSLLLRTGAPQRWNPILSRSRPTKCEFSPLAPFSNWQDEADGTKQPYGHNNGIFIMLAGWAYILTKKLLEKQDLPMQYSTNLAPVTDCDEQSDTDKHCITIDIGDATSHELLWWRALLAPGQGWQAPRTQQPPWAITYEGDLMFRVATTARSLTNSQSEPPPSSSQAVQFLSRFSARYCLGTQSSAALAMALTLPLLNLAASSVQLPEPRLGRPRISSSIAPAIPCQLLEDFGSISKYMTLSSNPQFLSSALWSTFWEPDVDCNLVSPWCDGIIEILAPLITNDLELLAHTLALRRPSLAPFWYGALLFGRTKLTERLIPFLKTQQAPTPARPIPEVALWTGFPQSYMDICGSGPYLREDNTISRADKHTTFRVPPFGVMCPDELELEVHRHVSCGRHRWQYDHWTWQFENGRYIHDEGCKELHKDFECGPSYSECGSSCTNFHTHHNFSYVPDNVATEIAVGAAFQWAATEMDVSSHSIFTHPWVGVEAFPEQDEPLVDVPPSFSKEAIERVNIWRHKYAGGTNILGDLDQVL
ncbi:hypothetical protein G7Y89_g3525 [Cudoniella acicularis]|uniref:Uncharacterized protein n=1 Tax=Cudoniella acicularis TaxID=354080 RepID=A0A8H4RSH8_9HELO|nr:hypothetical protein G7Y89_g3525 [Cudoniella acicularis]